MIIEPTIIDSQVAQEVMEWYLEKERWYSNDSEFPYGIFMYAEKDWMPSVNIHQAFMVVEQMLRLGWTAFNFYKKSISITMEFSGPDKPISKVDGILHYDNMLSLSGKVICIAALEAVRG